MAPHTVIGGHHLSVIAAQAILGLFEQVASFAALPLGAVLTDRCERKWVYGIAVLVNCQEALVSASTIDFQVLICSSVVAGLAGGVCGPAFGALQCDVLPKDSATGRVLHAARDQQLLNYAGFVPGLLLPVWLGESPSLCPSATCLFRLSPTVPSNHASESIYLSIYQPVYQRLVDRPAQERLSTLQ